MATPSPLTAPQCPTLPDPPTRDFWNSTQWAVFLAIMDSAVPAVVPKSRLVDKLGQHGIPDAEYAALIKRTAQDTILATRDEAVLKAFLEDRPSTNPIVRGLLLRTLYRFPAKQRAGLGMILSALSSSVGAFLLTGACTPFHQQPVHTREAVLQGWRNSWSPTIRRISRSLTRLAQIVWLMDLPIFREVTGYPAVPPNWAPGADVGFTFLQFPARPALDFDSSPSQKAAPVPAADDALPAAVIDTDIVIVGSGCGGAVAAKILAEAGHRVLVVDKGRYFPPSALPMPGPVASAYLFDRGLGETVDRSVTLLAGSTWGGGGTVNWSVALRTGAAVREEWAAAGLPLFAGPEYDACLDRVCARMGVGTEAVVQTHRGRVLLEGARKLGWAADVCPQNSGGKEHACGYCTMGCGSGEKQGPTRSWLPDAAAAGAEFIEGFDVDRITFEEDESGSGKRRATGVVGKWTSRDALVRDVVVKAKRVIVACGALRSPLLLAGSGLINPNIGRNLHLHPTGLVGAFFPEDAKPWEGAIISSYCTEFANLDGQGHGVHLETNSMTPYTSYAQMPWRSGLDFKLAALRYRHFASFISVVRDRDSGRVHADPATGAMQVDYTPSAFDRGHVLAGVLALCRILHVMGAAEIDAYVDGVPPFVRSSEPADDERHHRHHDREEDGKNSSFTTTTTTTTEKADDHHQEDEEDAPRFAAWLEDVRRVGAGGAAVALGSAHQMGSCRMSATKAAGVVDPQGKVWGVDGLYVADASVFPSASGVNPMVTVMAIADWIARAVDGDLKKGLGGGGESREG